MYDCGRENGLESVMAAVLAACLGIAGATPAATKLPRVSAVDVTFQVRDGGALARNHPFHQVAN